MSNSGLSALSYIRRQPLSHVQSPALNATYKTAKLWGPPLPQALKDYSTKSGLIWARLARFGEFLPLWVLCTVSVLGLGAVAEKGRVITVTVDTIDSVITIGAVVTSIGIVIAMVRRRRMTTRVVSFPWSIPSVSSEAFSFVPNWKYF